MATVTIEEAQAKLTELKGRLNPGEEIVITQDQRFSGPHARQLGPHRRQLAPSWSSSQKKTLKATLMPCAPGWGAKRRGSLAGPPRQLGQLHAAWCPPLDARPRLSSRERAPEFAVT